MKIYLEHGTEIALRAWSVVTNLEFSGLADVLRKDGDLFVFNHHVLDVGTFGFTDFTPEMMLTLPRSENRRCWLHRHPITCWSGTDVHTMTRTPCGGLPELIQWAVSIVWTPKGWLGRLDTFVPQPRHFDLEVVSQFDQQDLYARAVVFARENNLSEEADRLHAVFIDRHENNSYPDENIDAFVKPRALTYDIGPWEPPVFREHGPYTPKENRPRKKNIVQKTFDWLLDKPRDDR
jgi:hypothetical protein